MASRRCIFQKARNELYTRTLSLTPTISAVLSIINVTFITCAWMLSRCGNANYIVDSFIFRCAIRSKWSRPTVKIGMVSEHFNYSGETRLRIKILISQNIQILLSNDIELILKKIKVFFSLWEKRICTFVTRKERFCRDI